VEGLRLFEVSHTFKESEFTGAIALFEIIEKLIFEEFRQDPYGEEESFSTGNPALFFRGQATAGNDTVDMGMIQEILSPGVDNSDEAEVCPETLWIPGQFQKGLGDRAKEEVIEDFVVS
jgi:hypothetical protein